MKYNILLICIFLSFTSYVNGRNYYIDSKKGNDFFDGSSETKAWKSLDKINQTTVFQRLFISLMFKTVKSAIWS